MESKLGIDFGGVIAEAVPESAAGNKELFGTAAVLAHAFDVLRGLNTLLEGRVWVISKAGPATEVLTRRWLGRHRFERETGISSRRVVFVRERVGKSDKCWELGITHFVDDQVKNLEILEGVVAHLFLFGARTAPPRFVPAADWLELDRLLRQSFETESARVPEGNPRNGRTSQNGRAGRKGPE